MRRCVAFAASIFFVASAARAEDDTVRVHVESASPITLARKVGAARWKPVCTAPCNVALPLDETYRVSGAHIAPSNEFKLRETSGGNVDVVVRESSHTRFTIGGVLAGAGGLVIAGGVVSTIIGAAWAGQDCSTLKAADIRGHCEGLESDGTTIRNVGLASIGVGLVAVLSGAYLMVNSARTTVSQPAARTPMWQSKVEPAGRAFQVPIVAGSF